LTRVIFDSSFLMALVETPTTWLEDMIDRVGKLEPVLLECVGEELQRLASGKGEKSRTARVALDLSTQFDRLPCGGARVDDEIISTASSEGALVATTDSELARAAKAAHLRVISLRKGRVELQ
jgi:rRNA-processing protein FCF1